MFLKLLDRFVYIFFKQGSSFFLLSQLDIGAFSFNDNTALAHTIFLCQVLVEEKTTISDVGKNNSNGEEEEGQEGFPELHDTVGNFSQDKIQPNISEHGEESSDKEYAEMLNVSHLTIRDNIYADTNDDKQVEGCGTDDGSRTEISGFEVCGEHFNNGQQDLRTEGRAMSVRLATVSFHTWTTMICVSPFAFFTVTSFSCEVIISMEPMKRSAMMDTPMKSHTIATK
ncbi:hypothetical protein Hamer_G020003 [Homarus americanus]|uniref:Uncharacterized protein n=1 Tax=Homarus americanus TaxID=6706 RepID=A0A8J5MKI2_HOMAM|nr:hypothetical protein Hamer_G020003 [Homarus americanus]